MKNGKLGAAFALCICLVLALVIWIYATNVEINKEKDLETLKEELSVTQNS